MSFLVLGNIVASGITTNSGTFAGQVTGQTPGSAAAFTTKSYVDTAVSSASGSVSKAIVSDSALLVVTTGTNTVTLSPDTTPSFTSVTATTITGTTGSFGGNLSAQNGSFSNSLTLSGTPIMHTGITGVTVSGANLTKGQLNFVGSRAANVSVVGNTITFDAGSGINNVVEDTTPQLGGNLDTNSFDIIAQTGNPLIIRTAGASPPSASDSISIATTAAGGILINAGSSTSSLGSGDLFLGAGDALRLQATTISGNEYRSGGTVSAQAGAFSTSLTISGIPVPIKTNPLRVPLLVPFGTTLFWTNMPATVDFFALAITHIHLLDTTGMSMVKLTSTRGTTPGTATARLGVRYSPTYSMSAANFTLATSTDLSVPISGTSGVVSTGWQNLLPGAVGEGYWALVGSGGDGVIDPVLGATTLEFRP